MLRLISNDWTTGRTESWFNRPWGQRGVIDTMFGANPYSVGAHTRTPERTDHHVMTTWVFDPAFRGNTSVMIAQHAAFDIARMKMQDQLAAADQRRLMADIREQRGDRRFIGIRRRLGAFMVRTGERMQALPTAETGTLGTAR